MRYIRINISRPHLRLLGVNFRKKVENQSKLNEFQKQRTQCYLDIMAEWAIKDEEINPGEFCAIEFAYQNNFLNRHAITNINSNHKC